ncbi:hypothetical protein [Luteolibacter luteus]|uniref:Uncharacterized protein n=1 Tax=Luteolibacter luteus TaxID=2728835 RepID=A0A858RDF8_9BACT|nr:hypothetical protein [Luteolibacter luteus]QJE94429.1 hypothetical protein HHL09_01050 [Luteolibacter luteus]
MPSAATAGHDKPKSRWTWGWASYLFLSAGAVGLLLVGRLLNYFEGLALGDSDVLIKMAIMAMLLLCLLMLGTLGLVALYRIIRRRDHWLKLGILALPAVAMVAMDFVPLPSFNDGVIEALRSKTTGAEFVALAKATSAKPPEWLKESEEPGLLEKKEKWLKTAAPLDRLGVEPYPKVSLQGETLLVEWGGPLSRRWGLAISSTPGVKPEIPSHAAHSEEIHPEVRLFNIYL